MNLMRAMMTARPFSLVAALGIGFVTAACGEKHTDLSGFAGTYTQGDKTLTVDKDRLEWKTSNGSEKIQFLTVKCETATKCVGSTAIFGDATIEKKDKTLSISG